ncbi:MAG: site-2 protease family protein [Planctomycetota bacterium]|jgi:Zn-dependent protease|nr:site-2 protease family protein [Planctomycetota bacterium]MDP6505530.1 site-2 protease family protein [Planctomycetota bacterium]
MEFITHGLVWYINLLLAVTLHEAAHAWAAYRLGDPTAYEGGQVSLDPRPHLQREPFGTIWFPIISFILQQGQFMMGWASAPYDPHWALRHPKRAAWMAAAGPASNLTIAAFAFFLLKVGLSTGFFVPPNRLWLATVVTGNAGMAASAGLLLSVMFSLNLILFIFNLLPLPPLDGSAILVLFLPEETAERYTETLMRSPFLTIIGLIIAWNFAHLLIVPIFTRAVQLLYS